MPWKEMLLGTSLPSVALRFDPSLGELLRAGLMDVRAGLSVSTCVVHLGFGFPNKAQISGLEDFHQHEIYKILLLNVPFSCWEWEQNR